MRCVIRHITTVCCGTPCTCALYCCAVVVVGGLPRSGIDQEVVAPVVVACGVVVSALALPIVLPVLGPGLLVCVVWFGCGALLGLVLLDDPSGVVPALHLVYVPLLAFCPPSLPCPRRLPSWPVASCSALAWLLLFLSFLFLV